jgi:hypothetical protein
LGAKYHVGWYTGGGKKNEKSEGRTGLNSNPGTPEEESGVLAIKFGRFFWYGDMK